MKSKRILTETQESMQMTDVERAIAVDSARKSRKSKHNEDNLMTERFFITPRQQKPVSPESNSF